MFEVNVKIVTEEEVENGTSPVLVSGYWLNWLNISQKLNCLHSDQTLELLQLGSEYQTVTFF